MNSFLPVFLCDKRLPLGDRNSECPSTKRPIRCSTRVEPERPLHSSLTNSRPSLEIATDPVRTKTSRLRADSTTDRHTGHGPTPPYYTTNPAAATPCLHQPLSSQPTKTAARSSPLPVVCFTPRRLRTRLRRRQGSRQRRPRYRSAAPAANGEGLNYGHRRRAADLYLFPAASCSFLCTHLLLWRRSLAHSLAGETPLCFAPSWCSRRTTAVRQAHKRFSGRSRKTRKCARQEATWRL